MRFIANGMLSSAYCHGIVQFMVGCLQTLTSLPVFVSAMLVLRGAKGELTYLSRNRWEKQSRRGLDSLFKEVRIFKD